MLRRRGGPAAAGKACLALLFGLLAPALSSAQLSTRPGNSASNPIDEPRDLSGLSIKIPRTPASHTEALRLIREDPFLAYQRGRILFQREFSAADGVFGESGKLDGPLLGDGVTHMQSRGHTNSCAICHNTPFRDAGAGATIAKNGGSGRQTPHLFGSGLLEMLGEQLREKITAAADTNHNGWISREEAAAHSQAVVIDGLDFGHYNDADSDGRPDLNPVAHPLYVDSQGQWLATAAGLDDQRVAGYQIDVQVFGFGRLYHRYRKAEASTLRTFSIRAFDLHLGMQVHDATTLADEDGNAWSDRRSLGGKGGYQPVYHAGRVRRLGDDADRDGRADELTEGDLDLIEWYQLNHPRPAEAYQGPRENSGRALFEKIGCAECHRPDWQLEAGRDRRFFDLIVSETQHSGRLEGKLDRFSKKIKSQPVTIHGIYTDLRYHDMGEAFSQLQFDGSRVTHWRTTPLWGVGSTAPYGHDGASLTLDDVIRRHGGDAEISRFAYENAASEERRSLLDFLRSLVLYSTDQIPCDINGDGTIASSFQVAGEDTGYERFNPEWLFQIPGRIEGPVKDLQGRSLRSDALTNLHEAYSLD